MRMTLTVSLTSIVDWMVLRLQRFALEIGIEKVKKMRLWRDWEKYLGTRDEERKSVVHRNTLKTLVSDTPKEILSC